MTTAECQAALAEARAAYHQLLLGGAIRTIVDQNGQRVEYSAANRLSLQAYIQTLEAQCGCTVPGTCVAQPTAGPMQFLF